MKIKKVGEPDKDDTTESSGQVAQPKVTKPPNTGEVNKNFIIIGSVIFFLLAATVVYFLVIKDKSDGEVTQNSSIDDLTRKEIELKERELKLKEKQLNAPPSSEQSSSRQTEFQNQAASKVSDWINALGNRNFSNAFNLMSPSIRGDYSKFSSSKRYGGITSTRIFSCETTNISGCSAEVVADYEAIDPYNKNGRYTQKFFVNNCSGYWQISGINNLNIQYY